MPLVTLYNYYSDDPINGRWSMLQYSVIYYKLREL